MLQEKRHIAPHFVPYPSAKIVFYNDEHPDVFIGTHAFYAGSLHSIQLFFAQRSENSEYHYAAFIPLYCRSHQWSFLWYTLRASRCVIHQARAVPVFELQLARDYTGFTFHIFSQYSLMERSEENLPMRATLRMDILAQACSSRKAAATLSWQSTYAWKSANSR